jgi:SET domain
MKGNSGYGVYTTEYIRQGEPFLHAQVDSPSIAILDYYSKTMDRTILTEYEQRARRQFYETFSSYWWTSGKPDHVDYLADQTADFQLTFGTLPNHHCLLESLEAYYPQIPYADGMATTTTTTTTNPSAGAYSYHGGRVFYANRNVEAGEEIYLNYGTCNTWFNLSLSPLVGVFYPSSSCHWFA